MRCVVCWFGFSPTVLWVVGNLEGVQLDHHTDTTPWRRFNSARPAEHFPWLNGLKKSTHWLLRPAKRCNRATTAETQWRGGQSQEDWPKGRDAARRQWVSRCAGTDGTSEGENRSSRGHLAGGDGWGLGPGDGGGSLVVAKWVFSTAHCGDHAVSELRAKEKANVKDPSYVTPSLSGGISILINQV